MSGDRYYKWLVLINVCLGQFMAALDSRALNIALPTISTDFSLLIAMAHASIGFLMPFYLQGVLHFSPSKVAIITITNSVMIVLVAPVAGWLSDRLGSRLLCTVGASIVAAAQFAIGTLTTHATPLRIVLPLGLAGTGWALFNSPNNSAIFGSVPREKLGVASGMTVTMSNVGHVMGVAVSSFLFILWMSSHGVPLEQGSTYRDWVRNTALFTQAFNLSCLAGALSACIAIFASAVRGSQRPPSRRQR